MRKEISDEKLALYLDNVIKKGRENFQKRLSCHSFLSQDFNSDNNDDCEYCIEEDFADDAETLEVLKVAQDAMKLFDDTSISISPIHDYKHINMNAAECKMPPADFLSDSSLSEEDNKTNNPLNEDDSDVVPMSF